MVPAPADHPVRARVGHGVRRAPRGERGRGPLVDPVQGVRPRVRAGQQGQEPLGQGVGATRHDVVGVVPSEAPEHDEILARSRYGFDLQRVAHLWNRGSVVRSWLLELAERAFEKDPGLESIRGYVEDSGEGRWTVQEAIDLSVPAPVLTLSLQARFVSRQEASFSAKVIAALRREFGGHAVKKAE